MNEAVVARRDGTISDILAALATADGTAGHAYPSAAQPSVLTASLQNLADAVHYLGMLHGRYPGVIDHAAGRTPDNAARAWLLNATEGFAAERAFLNQLTVAVGPIPSTAGQAECEATVVQQRHALDMLAQSDRRGCAMGAAMALALDWVAVREALDLAALRVSLQPPPCRLPSGRETLRLADMIAGGDEIIGRAIQFGARQLLRQHRGLWDLLQARAAVRAQG